MLVRIYSGAKFRSVEEAPAGAVAAVTGLSRTRPGDGLGFEDAWAGPVLEPVLASVWGLLLFRERPGVLVVFGGTLILLGIGLYSREEA